MVGKATRRFDQPHGHMAPLHAARTPDFSVCPAARGSPSRHRPSDDARCATQDPPNAFPPRRRSAVRLAPDRVQRLVSRALDDLEEATNRNRTSVPREHLVLYQFSARGHDVAQSILGTLLDHPHDGGRRLLPLAARCCSSLGLSIEDALGEPAGPRRAASATAATSASSATCRTTDGRVVLPMSGDVGSQYTPAAGWAQAITYHRDVLGDRSYDGAIAVVLGGEASVATNGFWSALTMATTLKLPMLFYIEDNGLGISVRGEHADAGRRTSRANLASFANLFVRDGDGCDPAEAAQLIAEVRRPRARRRRARRSFASPCRACAATRVPTTRRATAPTRRSRPTSARDPLPQASQRTSCRRACRPSDWTALEAEVERDVRRRSTAARARPAPDPANVRRFVYAERAARGDADGAGRAHGRGARGARRHGRAARPSGDVIRFAEAVRRTLARELEVNPKVLVFGEDVGREGRRAPGDRRAAEASSATTACSTRASPKKASSAARSGWRSPGLDAGRRDPVPQVRRSRRTEQLNNCGTMRWRTANRFAAPIVVRMPGGFGKDVGDPWHSLTRRSACGRTPSAGRWRCRRTRPTRWGCCARRCGARTRRSSSSTARCS